VKMEGRLVPCLNRCFVSPEGDGITVDEVVTVGAPVSDFERLLCHGTACIVREMRDLILSKGKSSIYSIKLMESKNDTNDAIAIVEADSRPRMHYVPEKTLSSRIFFQRLIGNRTALINHIQRAVAGIRYCHAGKRS